MTVATPTRFKRALSFSEINRCETAKEEKCVCRCHGQFHGARRVKIDQDATGTTEERLPFEKLPVEDPHHLLTKQEAKVEARRRKAERSQHGFHRRYKSAGTIRYNWQGDAEICPLCLEEGKAVPEFELLCHDCDYRVRDLGDGKYEHDLSDVVDMSEEDQYRVAGHKPRPYKNYLFGLIDA